MTTATLRISTPLPEVRTAPQKNFLKRVFDAMVAARMRQAIRELEHAPPPDPAAPVERRGLRGGRQRRQRVSVHALRISVTHSPNGMRRTSVSPCGR